MTIILFIAIIKECILSSFTVHLFSFFNMSQVLPAFTCSAIFVASKPEDKDGVKTGKIILNFATEAINKHFGVNTHLSPIQTSARVVVFRLKSL